MRYKRRRKNRGSLWSARIVLVGWIVLLAFSLPSAQSQTSGGLCRFRGVHRSPGWDVPGLRRATLLGIDEGLTNLAKSQGIVIRKMKPTTDRVIVERYSCSADGTGRIDITALPIRVDGLLRLERTGRIFAYLVSASWVGSEQDGHDVELGGVSNFIYYDVAGKGEFTVMEEQPLSFPVFIPRWVNHQLSPEEGLR